MVDACLNTDDRIVIQISGITTDSSGRGSSLRSERYPGGKW